MLEMIGEPAAVALAGLFGGILLGLASRLGRFCTLGAIEDAIYASDTRRIRMWGVAIGVAIVGSFGAMGAGLVQADQTLYLAQAWNPLASVLGGLVFGYGMALAGNCGFGALARFGGGDLRAFDIDLVMGLASFAVLSGPFAQLRVTFFPPVPVTGTLPGFAHMIGDQMDVSPVAPAFMIGGLILVLALASREMLQSRDHVIWGAIVGVAIVTGWVGTSWVAENGFERGSDDYWYVIGECYRERKSQDRKFTWEKLADALSYTRENVQREVTRARKNRS